ncbi:MAG: hypothetical protein LUB61_05840 [Eggerthellaceae bacterium]|nr:hypothetical protein [Eggerthellaceae bacterium]
MLDVADLDVGIINSWLTHMDALERQNKITELEQMLRTTRLDDALILNSDTDNKTLTCPSCGASDYVRNGYTRGGKQRYKCKGCGHTFTKQQVKTIVGYAHLPHHKISRFIEDFVDDLPLAKCAENADITLPTAYYLHYRLQRVIEANLPNLYVEGKPAYNARAEVDETFIWESFKGNHTCEKNFEMPRPPFQRGRDREKFGAKRVQGTTKAYNLTVMSVVDATGRFSLDIIGRGIPNKTDLYWPLLKHIGKHVTVITDELPAYEQVMPQITPDHQAIASKYPSGALNLTNAIHSAFKSFIMRKRGVSSRRLSLYCCEFAWRSQAHVKDIATRAAADGVIDKVATTPETPRLVNTRTPYPYIDWWRDKGGRRETERLRIADLVFKANCKSASVKHHPANIVRAWVLYAHAKDAIKSVRFPENRKASRIGKLIKPDKFIKRKR